MQDINIRLKKIIGQLNSLSKTLNDKDCNKIIIQFLAVKEALNSAFSKILELNLEKCLKNNDKDNIQNILKLISKK
jgi:DNA-binding FrmR family transcriptional regulator